MTSKTLPQVVAILAGGLVLSSFALAIPAGAQTTTTTTTTTSASVTFARDLTIGSTGADVTALQTWLLSTSFSIPAGATGYFGTQTQAAVAAYQAANGITPAAGYFGPITRSRVNSVEVPAPVPTPAPEPEEDNSQDEDTSKEGEAQGALDDSLEALENARDEVQDAHDDGESTDDAEEQLDEAENFLDEASDDFDDKNYDRVADLIEDADDLIEKALDDVDANNDDVDGDDNVETSAEVKDRSGSDNDTATFEIQFNLNSFNQDTYVAKDESVSFNYEIQDSNGDDVGGATSLSGVLQSSADKEGNYFLVEDGEEESFTLTVTFDPLAVDEGEYYRLQLQSVEFNDSAAVPDRTWTAQPENRFRTDYVYIVD